MLYKLLLDSWNFFRNHLRVLAFIILPIVLPIEIFAAIFEYHFLGDEPTMQELLMLRIPAIIAAPIYSVAVVFYIASIIGNKPLPLTSMWLLGIRYWLVYFLLTLMIGMMAGFGLLLFILPGLFLLAKFAFAQFELLLHGHTPPEALRRSWQRTTGHTATLLGGYVVLATLFIAVYLVLGTLIGLLYPDYSSLLEQKSAVPIVFGLVVTVIFAVLECLFTIFAFRVYDEARKQTVGATG